MVKSDINIAQKYCYKISEIQTTDSELNQKPKHEQQQAIHETLKKE